MDPSTLSSQPRRFFSSVIIGVRRSACSDSAEIEARQSTRLLLERRIPGLDDQSLDDAALIIATVVHETIHTAVAARPNALRLGSVAQALSIMAMA